MQPNYLYKKLIEKWLIKRQRYECRDIADFASVRGYRQDFLLADNGVFASAEVQVPILRSGGTLQIIPFADFGAGWNAGIENPDSNVLASVGLGLQWRGGENFSARVDWGIPLVSVNSSGRTWQENGVLFSVQYNAF